MKKKGIFILLLYKITKNLIKIIVISTSWETLIKSFAQKGLSDFLSVCSKKPQEYCRIARIFWANGWKICKQDV